MGHIDQRMRLVGQDALQPLSKSNRLAIGGDDHALIRAQPQAHRACTGGGAAGFQRRPHGQYGADTAHDLVVAADDEACGKRHLTHAANRRHHRTLTYGEGFNH